MKQDQMSMATSIESRVPFLDHKLVEYAATLPDRILSPGTLVIENGRIAEIRPDAPSVGSHSHFAFHDHYIVPGFIDVHVHGVDGIDTLDDLPGGDSIAKIAAELPRYGVTATCRASFGLYNTRDEVDSLARALTKAQEIFA